MGICHFNAQSSGLRARRNKQRKSIKEDKRQRLKIKVDTLKC
jgi:hypothetical protein